MADTLTSYEGFPRRNTIESVVIGYGYDYTAQELVAIIQSGLSKLDPSVREVASLGYPDEDWSEWSLSWRVPETDEAYTARYEERQRQQEARRRAVREDWTNLCTLLSRAETFDDSRKYRARMENVRRVAEGLCVDLPEPPRTLW